jgi:hypothetical protein
MQEAGASLPISRKKVKYEFYSRGFLIVDNVVMVPIAAFGRMHG